MIATTVTPTTDQIRMEVVAEDVITIMAVVTIATWIIIIMIVLIEAEDPITIEAKINLNNITIIIIILIMTIKDVCQDQDRPQMISDVVIIDKKKTQY